jgi:hypothetical protein
LLAFQGNGGGEPVGKAGHGAELETSSGTRVHEECYNLALMRKSSLSFLSWTIYFAGWRKATGEEPHLEVES